METIEMNATPTQSSHPQLTPESVSYLVTTAKWGKFLAVLGFIVIGLLVLFGLLFGVIIGVMQSDILMEQNLPFSPALLSLIYIIIALIMVIPCIYLNNFSNKVAASVRANDTNTMNQALRNLKNLFLFTGIYTIVVIVLYVLIFLFAIVFAAFSL